MFYHDERRTNSDLRIFERAIKFLIGQNDASLVYTAMQKILREQKQNK